MKKRIVTGTLSVLLLCSTVVWAASVNGEFEGLPIVNVKINGETVTSDVPAVKLSGRTVLPVRAIAESLNAIVKWDEKTATASLIKPDVSIIIAESATYEDDNSIDIDNIWGFFTLYGTNRYVTFDLYVESGPLAAGYYEYRTIILDPDGNIIYTTPIEFHQAGEDDYGILSITECTDVSFFTAGIYKFEFQMKQDGKFYTVCYKNFPAEVVK